MNDIQLDPYQPSAAHQERAALHSRIAELERALAEAQQRNQWQPISTAPKDGTLLLGWWQHGMRGNGWPFILLWARHLDDTPGGTMCWMDFTCACPRESSYWQPLPPPPERDKLDGNE